MSTISFHQQDHSDQLCRRFASLAASYFDAPAEAQMPAARVPLENLFRVLQMYRYDAFSDERRSGVLMLQSSADPLTVRADEEHWHAKIETALTQAIGSAFGGIPKDQAIEQVQSVLRWLATSTNAPPQDVRLRSKAFLNQLIADLS